MTRANGGRIHLDTMERVELMRRAAVMRHQGMSQREIAKKLEVSQPTVCHWLAKVRDGGLTAQERVAAKLRAELVCCDIYECLEVLSVPGREGEWEQLRRSPKYHAICHYGEWAARIALAVK